MRPGPAAAPGSVRPPDLDRRTRDAVRGAAHPSRSGALAGLAELPLLVVAALLMAFVLKTFLVQAFYIPSGSMIPALQVGDRVLVEKLTYRFRSPERGEVLVFRRPGADPPPATSPAAIVRSFLEGLGLVQPSGEIDLIKRVIGLPGETVAVRDGIVLIDGEPLDEPYAQQELRDFGPVTVPDGHVFMLGDNRMNSDDSRFSLGPVPLDNVVGRAFVILWPLPRATLLLDRDYPGVPEGAGDWPGATAAAILAGRLLAAPSPCRRTRASTCRGPSIRRRRLLTHEPHRPRRHRLAARRRSGLPSRRLRQGPREGDRGQSLTDPGVRR